jgi:class 3 adenylate cyclase/predicted ATPase
VEALCDIREWLASLGLSEYADRFAENRIAVSVLRDLTDEDLKDLGVVLGDRRRMLRAIVELAGTAPARPQSTPGPQSMPRDEAERRQVTVMFADLVDSTALSTRMDPEDLREIIAAYQECVGETVADFGGYLARYVGDGALVYFGYPQAHEDDAEQAVRAGLELIAAVSALKTRVPLQIRIGIATGLVVVGHIVGLGEAQERGMAGETPNLATGLQRIAQPNMAVIAESTRRLLGDLFELMDLGAKYLEGIAGRVQAWTVLRARSVESRFEALHATGLTALVGRKGESELLIERWSWAKGGEGQVVLLSGEPGIGKSRLTAEFMDFVADEPHTRLRYFCSPQHTNSAFYPIIVQIQNAAGLAHDDSLDAKLEKLDAVLAQSATSMQDRALFAEMLSLPSERRYPALNLSPQERRQKTLEALTLRIEALEKSRPVLIIFEDLHWIDPTSLEALGRAVDRIRSLRVLLIMTFRPEFEPPWIGHPHLAILTLGRLPKLEVDNIIDLIAGSRSIPASIRQDIIERTDGIPLFVEEMTKAVLEAGDHVQAGHTAAGVPFPTLAVPASLQASLMARLDRLGSAKELAQVGAAIGRQFSHALLAAVWRRPEAQLKAALGALISAGLLFRQGAAPQERFTFKHVLVADAAYGTLLREPKRALHARIVETLETDFKEIAGNRPELLAHHCSEAGQIQKAARLWGEAGQRSLERSALVEAVAQLKRALEQIAALAPTPALRCEEIKLQVALITPLLHVKGYAAPETVAAAERARLLIEKAEALGEAPESPLSLFSALYALWVARLVEFNGELVRELAAEFLARAEKQAATGPLMVGYRLMGMSLLHTGDIGAGLAHLERAIALYDPAEHRPLATRFGQDVGVAILAWKSIALWLLGYPKDALANAEHALKIAREIGHAATLMYALTFATWTDIQCGNWAAAEAQAERDVALADEKGIVLWKGFGMMHQAQLFGLASRALDALDKIIPALNALQSTRTTMWIPLWQSYLTGVYADLGRFEDARRCIGEAIAVVEATKERWCEAEINRIAGDVELRAPQRDVTKAEFYLERALAVARQQEAKSWELRAATSLARVRRDQGRRHEARDLLAPVYGWFRQGLNTCDLMRSKALLDELA